MSKTKYSARDAEQAIRGILLDPDADDLADTELIAIIATQISETALTDITRAMLAIDLVRAYDERENSEAQS